MVNKANVLRVADAIENAELVKRGIGFNMANYLAPSGWAADGLAPDLSGHDCGTVACIAGTAAALLHPRMKAATLIKRARGWSFDPYSEGATYLDLTYDEAVDLFAPACQLSSITPAHAVAVLRHLAETGEVDWSVRPAKASDGGA